MTLDTFSEKVAHRLYTPAFAEESGGPSDPTIPDHCTVASSLPCVSGANAERLISVFQIANLVLQIANLELSNVVSVN
jgi:hypothetical protein